MIGATVAKPRHKARARKARRDRQKERARAAVRARLESAWSPVIDVMVTRLHEELVKWPDVWTLPDRCGEGNNPHQWHVLATSQWRYAVRFVGIGCATGGTFIDAGDAVCVCGVIKSDLEAYLAEAKNIMFMLDGLRTRDVQ